MKKSDTERTGLQTRIKDALSVRRSKLNKKGKRGGGGRTSKRDAES